MHVIVATDGSPQSLAAARHLTSFADPQKITTISVVAVIRPLSALSPWTVEVVRTRAAVALRVVSTVLTTDDTPST